MMHIMASATGILENIATNLLYRPICTRPNMFCTDQLHQLHMNFKEEKLYEKCKIDTW